ncbi:MAG: hypothetical protein IJJ99_03415 [Oscillospiraceae bacterium]|nr:hypothetical protein [Oscillospiraceae bacterium]
MSMSSFLSTPSVPDLSLEINGSPIGLVHDFREQMTVEVTAAAARGSNLPAGLHPGAVRYRLQLNRVLLDNALLTDGFSPYGLHGFTLSIIGQSRTVRFTGCEFTSVTVRSEAGASVIEEAELMALDRVVVTGGGS